MTDIVPFDYEGQAVRTVLVDGEPWFVLADLCAVLGLTTPARVAERLDQAGVSQTHISSGGQRRSVTIVSEAGMYEVVIRSDKPEAVTFRRWITGTVLPEIRRTGSFNPAAAAKELTRADLARMVLEAEEEKSVLAAALKSAEPAIAYHDRYVIDSDVVTVQVWGAQFGLTMPQAFQLLRDKKVVYRHSLGERWSASRNRREEVFEHRAYAGRKSFEWFDLRPQHNAPRHHNGQVRQTLYVRQAFALDLGKACGLTPVQVAPVAADPADGAGAA